MSSSNLSGVALLENPKENQGTAFTQQEREKKELVGLLPPVVETLEVQLKRCLYQLSKKNNDLEQYIYLTQLADDIERCSTRCSQQTRPASSKSSTTLR